MLLLIDTNVISEVVKPVPNGDVVAWMRDQSPLDLRLSVLSLGELERGIALLPAGERPTRLTQWARAELPRHFLGRVLSIDERVAGVWGQLSAAGHTVGRPLPVIDGLIVATAAVHALTLVTRNVSDCAGRGVPVLDPWSGTLHQ